MEKENVGVFSIEINSETGKYVIVYIEKGEKIIIEGEEYNFDSYDTAEDYLRTHEEELNGFVTNYKKSLGTGEEDDEDDKTQEDDEDDKTQDDEKKRKKSGWFIKFLSGFLAAVITLVGGHYIAKGISSSIKGSADDSDTVTTGDAQTDEKDETDQVVPGKVLTTEEFQQVTAKFAKLYTDRNLNITTEDLVKFVSIVNIDRLIEDNPELASELFAGQSKEEYLNDAAKVIGLTYTYNRNIYQKTGKTDGFIKISDSAFGDQKHALQIVETYVDLIATYSYDAEQANLYITNLIMELGDPNSSLSYLDDGIGYGMQVSIELIRGCIAKDVISQKNLDALTLLTSSEEYISNIFAVYDKCNSSYSKTR